MGAFYATLSFSCQAKAKPGAFVAALLLLWQLSSNHMIVGLHYVIDTFVGKTYQRRKK
jgi:succinate dehydrogenase hydrophobic anchor subunit